MGTFCDPFVLFEFLLPHSVSVVARYFCLHSGACVLVPIIIMSNPLIQLLNFTFKYSILS